MRRLIEAHQMAASDLIGSYDHVTRLPNRTSFIRDHGTLADCGRDTCLVLVTLADAKHFNDLLRALGHAYAEDFVRAGATLLAELLPDDTRLYHVSVLSFAFFTTDMGTGREPAVITEIVSRFRHSIVCQDIPVDTKAGVGVTSLRGATANPSELLRATLVAAQDSRRSYIGWSWYDSKSDEAHQRAFRILTDLPSAFVASDQLSLEFQPRIALRDNICVSAEALVRWAHPRIGRISPAEFVPLAEATALITPLTQWVFERAMMAIASWRRRFDGLKISVNISPKNLEEPDFADRLRDLCNRWDVDPATVELEFTEGLMGGNWHLMMSQMQRLRADGFEIAIDDFGSGYSNMSYLGKIPAGCLKIDQAFVRTLDTDSKNQVLVRAIIDLAHALNYSVVAEGIETDTAFDLLTSWGCDEGQGYLMSRPLPEPTFEAWILHRRLGERRR